MYPKMRLMNADVLRMRGVQPPVLFIHGLKLGHSDEFAFYVSVRKGL
jgi:hypothetical protein